MSLGSSRSIRKSLTNLCHSSTTSPQARSLSHSSNSELTSTRPQFNLPSQHPLVRRSRALLEEHENLSSHLSSMTRKKAFSSLKSSNLDQLFNEAREARLIHQANCQSFVQTIVTDVDRGEANLEATQVEVTLTQMEKELAALWDKYRQALAASSEGGAQDSH